MTASDKLVIWLFQSHPDRLLQRLPDLPEDAGDDRFVALVVKALDVGAPAG